MSASKKILVVDDDAFIRRPLEFILREEGYEAVTARDGRECDRRLEEGTPDLIILDVMMPGEDGFSVCDRLKKDPRHRDVPIVLLSARGRETDRERGTAVGAVDFMTKPYSPSELLRRVREILARGQDRWKELASIEDSQSA